MLKAGIHGSSKEIAIAIIKLRIIVAEASKMTFAFFGLQDEIGPCIGLIPWTLRIRGH